MCSTLPSDFSYHEVYMFYVLVYHPTFQTRLAANFGECLLI